MALTQNDMLKISDLSDQVTWAVDLDLLEKQFSC